MIFSILVCGINVNNREQGTPDLGTAPQTPRALGANREQPPKPPVPWGLTGNREQPPQTPRALGANREQGTAPPNPPCTGG
ncbi:hypothetical protein PA905_30530 [Planktothrix agardhii CCAP 1459/11A]|uniref:Uncharacterized protein n=1 Tax=Planktothrix agardhii CCAP 1459/11A TaxID=282420 RepID=A0A479ZRE0_PLAAG|nr:hypothetical protein PA905_30530 [Planktothrix agardhii CCAP 1459/11A]CAD5952347.1 hypothetical protein NO108_03004 [Planktothrix rubescens]